MTGHRWVASLANYNFSLHYKTGKTTVDMDDLFRIPWDTEIAAGSVQTIMNILIAAPNALFEAFSHCNNILESIQTTAQSGNMTTADWIKGSNPI